jgi:hypothetical protein
VRPTSNPYLKRIACLVGEKDTKRALQLFVSAQRGSAESLEDLAGALGVSRIVQQRLPFEGGLFKLPDGELVIKLNAQSSFVRRRFTMAHEIGHLLLNTVPAFRSTERKDAALERTCDLIAAELLMPTDEACDYIRSLGPPSPEKLKEIASKFVVSLQTAALRVLCDFNLWRCCAGMWESTPNVKTLWFVGARRWDAVEPASNCLEFALASNTSVRTTDLWSRGNSTELVWLKLLGTGFGRVLGLVHFVN